MFNSENDEGIIIDLHNTRKHTRKILCVICKVQLDYIAEITFKCPICHNKYFLDIEILEHEDTLESSHENEAVELTGLNNNSVGLLTADNDDIDFSTDDEKKSGFYSMDYVLGPGRKMVEYHEEIQSEEENND